MGNRGQGILKTETSLLPFASNMGVAESYTESA